jgi:hypothetical protein
MSTRLHRRIPLLLAGALAIVALAATAADAKPIRLADATMIVEVNGTDRDAGLQVFLDGEPWTRMAVFAPDGRKVLAVDARGRLNRFGLTELFSESHEPEFSELPLAKFKRRFPAGIYRFSGRTTGGRRLVGRARLSHAIPRGPRITSPQAGAAVPEQNLVARWEAVPQRKGVHVVGYRVIVERDDPLRVFSADLPASVTSVTVPAEFLEPGTPYKIEIQAIDRSGNQTISELEFRVS